jgi:hypothetical protein
MRITVESADWKDPLQLRDSFNLGLNVALTFFWRVGDNAKWLIVCKIVILFRFSFLLDLNLITFLHF